MRIAYQTKRTIDDLRSLQYHEDGEDKDRHSAGHTGRNAAEHAGGRSGQARRGRPDPRLVILDIGQCVGPFEQAPDRSAAGARVLQQLWELGREGGSFSREREGKSSDKCRDDDHDDEKDEKGGYRARHPTEVALHPTDERVQGDGEERGDDDPHDDPSGLVDQQEKQGSCQDHTDRYGDGTHGYGAAGSRRSGGRHDLRHTHPGRHRHSQGGTRT